MNLSLKIAGEGLDDFYPYELALEEGFSKVYRAELMVFTRRRRDQKKLRELLERKATVIISQRLPGGTVSRLRYLHGIITAAADLGVVSRGKSADCYRHVITIESELARLRHTRLINPYYRKTPPDIIEEIFSHYGIKGEFSSSFINRSSFSKNLMFDQTEISDLDFILQVMELYGISWTYVHGKASQGSLGQAELYFSEGNRYPPAFYEYSDKRKVPEIERFDFMDYDAGKDVWKMDRWRMESRIGAEGLEVSAPYPLANYGSQEWRWGDVKPGKRHYDYGTLFHGFDRQTPNSEIDADIKRIIEAFRTAFAAERENWSGGTQNIAVLPGLVFELRHFQGAGDGNVICALVTDSALRFRVHWPRDLAAPPLGEEPGELSQVEFSSVDWGKDSEKRFCRNGRRGKGV
jgi:hypothetical protein